MHIRAGALTVDAERVRSYNAAKADLAALNLPPGAAPPPALAVRLARFSPRQWFFVPVKDSRYAGVVLPSPTDAYDLGPADNVALALGPKGLAALLPWNAVAPARSFADMVAWPLSPVARLHLETEAQRIVDEAKTTAA
jgi:hypothetical protein